MLRVLASECYLLGKLQRRASKPQNRGINENPNQNTATWVRCVIRMWRYGGKSNLMTLAGTFPSPTPFPNVPTLCVTADHT